MLDGCVGVCVGLRHLMRQGSCVCVCLCVCVCVCACACVCVCVQGHSSVDAMTREMIQKRGVEVTVFAPKGSGRAVASAWHDSYIHVTWLIRICDMTHQCVWHDSFIRVTWRVDMCDSSYDGVSCTSHMSCVYVCCVHVCCVHKDISSRNVVFRMAPASSMCVFVCVRCVCVCVCFSWIHPASQQLTLDHRHGRDPIIESYFTILRGLCPKVQSEPSATARVHRHGAGTCDAPCIFAWLLRLRALTLACIKPLSRTLPNLHGASIVVLRLTSPSCRGHSRIFCTDPNRGFCF